MSDHEKFLLLAIAGFIITLPVIIFAITHHLAFRWLAVTLFGVGFALIGAAFIIDPTFQPPLFYHGYVPGIGIGFVALALGLVVQHRDELER